MTELVELSNTKHSHLNVVRNCATQLAARQHVINLRAVEVGRASSSFPVFFTRNSHSGNWVLSAMASFEPGRNLFVMKDEWLATYQPTAIQTYPLYLMQSENKQGYTLGIHEQSDAFSEQEGEALFDENGKASLYLSRVTAMLEADIKNDIQTYKFAEKMEELDLFKALDLLVHYQDGPVQTLKGLHTLDEDKMQLLSGDQLKELNTQGYLAPMHAMLISLFQINSLIKRHNAITEAGHSKITQVKMSITRDSEVA